MLDTAVKLELLFVFPNMRKRQLEELKEHIEAIFELAQQDEDEWVRVIAELLRGIMEKQPQLLQSFANHNTIFRKTREDVLKMGKLLLP